MITPDQLSEFLQQRPPRVIPKGARPPKGSKGLIVFGLIFALFGSIFLVVFFPWKYYREVALKLADVNVVEGRVESVAKTNMSIGGSKHRRGTPVFRYRARFEVSGAAYSVVSYRTGKGKDAGDSVNVKYSTDNPELACIVGMRLTPAGLWASFVAIFPAAGLVMFWFGWRWRSGFLRLLRRGTFEYGRVEDVTGTSVHVNNQRRYKVTVSYDGPGDTSLMTTYNAYGAEVRLAEERMKSDERVGILVDPIKPGRALLIETLLK